MRRNEFADQVIDVLENAVRGRQVVVLGAPFSGKTDFLNKVKAQLLIRQRNWVAFRAGNAGDLFTPFFFENLLNTLKSEGCINTSFYFEKVPVSLASFFKRVDNALHKENIRHLVILVDDLDEEKISIDQISNLLSTIRGFYTEWDNIEINIHFVFAGNFNTHTLLDIYRGSDSASWPLLRNKTIFFLPLLTKEEIEKQLLATSESKLVDIHASYIYEITNGDCFTVNNLLLKLGSEKHSCQAFFAATENLIKDLSWIESIKSFALRLSPEAYKLMVRNLHGQIVFLPDRDLKEELLLSGLFSLTSEGGVHILNSVIERTLRRNWSTLFPTKEDLIFKDTSELIPPVFVLNKKAFELINAIEMRLRNLVVIRLGVKSPKQQKHFLSGLNYEKNPYTEQNEDQYFRSNDWRLRVSKSRYVDTHAALISFTNTKDLLGLIDHLINENDSVLVPLKNVRPKLSGLKEIRDAVMHGQVITEQTIENLVDINSEITKMLSAKMDS